MGKSYFATPTNDQGAPNRLDQAQQRVRDLPVQTPAVIWGAPGSGKTTTLIELVASRVEAGENPDNLLVLSPNRSAATRLRDRLAARIGQISQHALARTPNSLAFAIVTAAAQRQGTELPRLLTGGEQDAIIKDLLEGNIQDGKGPQWPDPLVEDVRRSRAFRTELRDLYSRCAELGWGYQELEHVAKKLNRPAWLAAAEFWRTDYENNILDHRLDYYDSASLLMKAASLVSAQDATSDSLPRYTTIFIDDAQEMTYGAIRLVRAFVERGANVIAFGDPDIAASTFRGAFPQFLGRFAEELGLKTAAVETIVLEHVHRHPRRIRELVQTVSEKIGTAEAGAQHKAQSLVDSETGAHATAGNQVVTILAKSPAEEVAEIARQLRRHHLMADVPLDRMAVVVRNGSMVAHYARALSAAEVPTRTVVAERSFKEQPAVLDLVTAVKLALSDGTDAKFESGEMHATAQQHAEAVIALLESPIVGLSQLDIRRLRLALRHQGLAAKNANTGSALLAQSVFDLEILEPLSFAPARAVIAFIEVLKNIANQAKAGAPIEELLWLVWEFSGLEKKWVNQALSVGLLADDANRNLDAVMALFTAARRFTERNPESPAVQFVDALLESDIPEDSLAPQAQRDSVLVATPASLIGSEFDVVVVAGVQENVWPNLRPRGSLLQTQDLVPGIDKTEPVAQDRADQLIGARKAVLDDELRFFTLALSRARQQVYISAIEYEDSLPSGLFFVAQSRADEKIDVHSEQRAPLSLRGLTGSLRRELASRLDSPDESGERESQELAIALAKLAATDVPGAHPGSWYGMSSISTSEPLQNSDNPDDRVSISPSTLEKFEKNQLAWFIDSVIGFNTSPAQGIGTIVHSVMENAAEYSVEQLAPELLFDEINSRWSELSFETEWLSAREKVRVFNIASAICNYLTQFSVDGKTLLASEGGFTLSLENADVRGYIDRIEEDLDGIVVIVDLKTGKYPPAKADIPEHAQMACYQLALVSGVLEKSSGEAITSPRNGGAKLLFLKEGKKEHVFAPSVQDPFTAEELDAIKARIVKAANAMSAATIEANVLVREEKGDSSSRYEYRIHTVRGIAE